MGVRRLTGINSEAINIATYIVIEPTALQVCALAVGIFDVIVFIY
jgi:hypothetical protein